MTTSVRKKMPEICFALTSPLVLNHYLLNHLHKLADNYQITVCINADEVTVSPRLDSRISLVNLPISRKINLASDLRILIALIRLFRHKRFDAIHTLTPKGGLLGMIAASITRSPIRTHSFTGQVWATHKGLSRFILKTMDRIIARCATHLNADSQSQAQFLEQENITGNTPVQVFGSGSISGVDLERFTSDTTRRIETRQQLGIPEESLSFLFLGRLNQDKGVLELAEAFKLLYQQHSHIRLIFVGRDEQNMTPAIKDICHDCLGAIRFIDLTHEPERYIDAADVLCLPSYREGFGSSIIEAAAMGVPSIASRIYGITDAVVDGTTGLLFTPGNIHEIQTVMQTILDDTIRLNLAHQAQERAKRDFSAERITQAWLDHYAAVLDQRPTLQ